MLKSGRGAASLFLIFIGVSRTGRCAEMLIDLFQLTYNFRAFGQNCANTFHVERANAGEDAQAVNDSFAFSILPDYRLLQTTSYVSNNLVCFNLGNPLDFHTQDLLALTGFRAGIDSPSFVAGGVRFPTLNRLVRSGQKRFAGMRESDYEDGVLNAGVLALIGNLADAMIGNWLASVDSHIVGNYVIVQRVCDKVDPVTGDCLQYRLPEPPETPVFYQPTARQINADATSQVSRKVF